MTAQQAKKESLLVWKYLAEHPEIRKKAFLPALFGVLIGKYENKCPLCEYFKNYYTMEYLEDDDYDPCCKCPLQNCGKQESAYYTWLYDTDAEKRKQAAEAIVKAIEEWEV